MKISSIVSVPSFGDSFFMKAVALGDGRYAVLAFPSPHSGILFLWMSRINERKLLR